VRTSGQNSNCLYSGIVIRIPIRTARLTEVWMSQTRDRQGTTHHFATPLESYASYLVGVHRKTIPHLCHPALLYVILVVRRTLRPSCRDVWASRIRSQLVQLNSSGSLAHPWEAFYITHDGILISSSRNFITVTSWSVAGFFSFWFQGALFLKHRSINAVSASMGDVDLKGL